MEDEAFEAVDRDAEMIAEAKLLRQHKGRLEARMQILEDHNRQLEAQLQRLRQLLDQVRIEFWFCALFKEYPLKWSIMTLKTTPQPNCKKLT